MSANADPKSMESLGDEIRRLWGLPPRPIDQVPRVWSEEEEMERVQKLVRDQRMESFKRFCPVHFLEAIDRSKIPNLAAWDEADAWSGGWPGVWLWSHDTGEAKTRMLWRKFGQLHVERGRSVVRVTGLNVAEDYAQAYREGRTTEFYGRFARMGCVMMDDLDKMELPDPNRSDAQDRAARNARMLRELFDDFYERHQPVLVTANEPIAWFSERIGKSGERRMLEVCREVAF